MNWNQIEIFKGIDLNDSFVLNWTQVCDQIRFELEVSIWPDSQYYSKPENGEYTCYRKATLIFDNIQHVAGLNPIGSVSPTCDPDGTKDFGNIDTFIQTENGFHLSGDFGLVDIIGGKLHFDVHI